MLSGVIQRRHIDWHGGRAHIIDYPGTTVDAEPALFLPGLGTPALSWGECVDAMRHRFDGHVLDLPGFGRSQHANQRRFTVQSMTEFVVRWLEHSERGPVHLFGSSLGGLLAIRAAALRPKLVRSLTLIAPAMPYLRGPSHLRYIAAISVPGGAALARKWLARLTNQDIQHWFRQALTRHCVDPERITDQRFTEAVAEMEHCLRGATFPDAIIGTLRSALRMFLLSYVWKPGSPWWFAQQLSTPTSLFWGGRDHIFPVELAPKVAAAIAGSRLRIFDDLGHIPHVEAPDRLAAAILEHHQPDGTVVSS